MALACRKSDKTFGICSNPLHGAQYGKILTGAANTFIEGEAAARVGDTVLADCGDIGYLSEGSSSVSIEGAPASRLNDAFVGIYSGVTIGSASKTDIG